MFPGGSSIATAANEIGRDNDINSLTPGNHYN